LFTGLASSVLGKTVSSLLLSLAREEELLCLFVLGKTSSFLLLSLVREEELLSVSSYSRYIRITMSKLFSLARSASTIGTVSSFLGLPTSLRSNRCNCVLETNRLAEFP
jgi:hypothetical protein